MRQPEWNAHQLAALDHLMALAQGAESVDQFLRESGDLLVLARAASLDRAANLRGAALRCDDPWLAGAARLEYLHALEGTSHVEFHGALLAAQAKSSSLKQCSAEVHGACEQLLFGLFRLHTSVDLSGELARDVEASFSTLLRLDPDFRPERWMQINRYRWRLPWVGQRVAEWLERYWPNELAEGESLPATGIETERENWVSELRRFGGVWPQVTPLELPALPESNVWQERQGVWRSATLAHHAAVTERLMARAATAISREAISTERSMDFGIEAAWSRLLMSSLLAPLRAAMEDALLGLPESRAALAHAVDALEALVGCGPRTLLRLPAVVTFLECNLNAGQDGLGALQGEAGTDLPRLVAELRMQEKWIDVEGWFADEDPGLEALPVLYRGDELPLEQYRG